MVQDLASAYATYGQAPARRKWHWRQAQTEDTDAVAMSTRGATMSASEQGGSMGVFDILKDQGYNKGSVDRMNLRWNHVVRPFADEISGATMLDLGSNDGRWPYAFVKAGARKVTALEGRGDVLNKIHDYAGSDVIERVELRVGDFFEEMQSLLDEGRTYDIVACLGVFYHTVKHFEMLDLMTRFKPKLIILDSIFANNPRPVVAIFEERTEREFNIIGDKPMLPIGRISVSAFDMYVRALGYQAEEVVWDVPKAERAPVGDYFDKYPNRTRRTFALRPA
jgi:2-polyprenyl-3-methyl-5-hydroxy-6-metoxy-1,4-benzoquinol methylase